MKAKVTFYGLVRDKDGKPKIDGHVDDLLPEIRAMLTSEEIKQLEGSS